MSVAFVRPALCVYFSVLIFRSQEAGKSNKNLKRDSFPSLAAPLSAAHPPTLAEMNSNFWYISLLTVANRHSESSETERASASARESSVALLLFAVAVIPR